MFNLVRVGKEWAGPVFSHPLTSNLMFYAYSGQGNLRLAEFFPAPLTICTTVFPHVITLCIRLMFNFVRVGKDWAGPVFPHPLKSKGYMCIHDRVRLAVFFRHMHTENRFFAGLDRFLVCKTDSIKCIFFGPKKHTLRIIYWPNYLDKSSVKPLIAHNYSNYQMLSTHWSY